MVAMTLHRDFVHVSAPIARRILVDGELPTHQLLNRAHEEAAKALAEDLLDDEVSCAGWIGAPPSRSAWPR